MNAGQAAGLEGAWCVVKEGLSDAEAMMYVVVNTSRTPFFMISCSGPLSNPAHSAVREDMDRTPFGGGAFRFTCKHLLCKGPLPSEKAAVLTLRYSEMFSQGKRNDIQRELEELERGSGTCGSDFHKSKNRDVLGEDYALTGRQVATYLRINRLCDGPVLDRHDAFVFERGALCPRDGKYFTVVLTLLFPYH